MSAIPKKRMTPAQYLEIERKAEFKSEFYAGEMFAMAGASPEHCDVKDNLISELGARLKGGPCRTRSSDQRLLVTPSGLYTYPDIIIVSGKPEYAFHDANSLTNPTVIIEVLSASTALYDCTTKLMWYQQIESLKEYVMVAQDRPYCQSIDRQADGSWRLRIVSKLSDDFAFASLPIRIPLADIYAGVTFPENPDVQALHPGS